jgi:hypothetical protein
MMMASTAPIAAPRTTAVSNCSWDGNRSNFKTVREQQCCHQTKQQQNHKTMGDDGVKEQQQNNKTPGKQGGNNKEEKQMKRGPRDIIQCLLGHW